MTDAPGATPDQDFLDDVVQSLFGAGLRLENCLHMLEDDASSLGSNLRGEIDSLIEGLHELIGRIRRHAHGS
jgi:hypothetical protein